jgi:hypothetical protein
LKPAWANSLRDPILKIPNTKKRVARVTQVVKCLPRKCEALSLNSNAGKTKTKTKTSGCVPGTFLLAFPLEAVCILHVHHYCPTEPHLSC